MTRRKTTPLKGDGSLPEELNLDLLPNLIGYQLRLTQLATFTDFAHELKDFEISPGRFGVLVLIAANPGLTQSSLAQATHLDRSTMVAVIDQLESRGLVERRASPTDRRSNALMLTADGKKLLRQLKEKVQVHDQRVIAALTPTEAKKFVALLKKVRLALQAEAARRTSAK